ncbi:MAG: TldD/PmbA family protein [Peptococcaceae bacterium]|nr:TldD/PmbA family protein [Peptococcaceae bacterium]
MQYTFPEDLYTDVRVEHLFSTQIVYTLRTLDECKVRQYSAAFIRLFDGDRWYYASTSDLNAVQAEIDALAKLARKPSRFQDPQLQDMKIHQNFSSHKETKLIFTGHQVSDVPLEDKAAFLETLIPLVEQNEYIKLWRLIYVDAYKKKEFYNSKGAALTWNVQRAGYGVSFQMADGDKQFRESFQVGKTRFEELGGHEDELAALLTECQSFLLDSEAVDPGLYPVVLAPMVTGVFTHECFGHKSEADFMIGDEATKKEWVLGKKVGPEELTIVESGQIPGMGYVPFDDEGNPATVTYLIKNGILTGRLHNAASAADLGEAVTGNARAINFEYEPIVRMTTTYLDNGTKSFDQLIAETQKGIYVKSISHGSGMSTFTLAPLRAYTIKEGKIDKPVRISVISGNVFESLSCIDGIANDREITAFVTGGCGKMGQYPLPVGFGGPHIRVRDMQIQ